MLLITPKSRVLSRRSLIAGASALTAMAALDERASAQSPCGSFYPTIPATFAAAGFSKLTMRDDFNVPGTVDPVGNATSGFNWYQRPGIGVTIADAAVSTTQTAAGISNGNTSGGAHASPLNGVITINCPVAGGNGNTTLISTPASTQNVSNPGVGCWRHFGCRTYFQRNPFVSANNQWYAQWWFTQLTTSGTHRTEIDTEEDYARNFGYADVLGNAVMTTGGHQWDSSTGLQVAGGGGGLGTIAGNGGFVGTNADQEWHLFDTIWQGTGTNTGYIQILIDNVLQYAYNNGNPLSTILTGAGGLAGYQWMEEGSPLYMQIGCPGRAASGGSGVVNYDYIEIWQ